MSATLRYRGNKSNLIEIAKTLDAFKKVPEKYTETTEIGGTLSLISRLLIVFLIYKEIQYYQDANLKYEFVPDTETEKVQMHVDITVAMPCGSLSGVDLMDETQQDVFAYGTLQRQDVWWKMDIEAREEFERQQHLNHFLREQYHSVADVLFKDVIKSHEVTSQPEKEHRGHGLPDEKYDACRLHGTLGIHKVAGVLHMVGGAMPVVDMIGDHLMIGFRRLPSNFTHRINRLSFGQYSKRLIQPLEGDETFVADESTRVQYFLNIVPTEIHTAFSTINTYQYSVTENIRVLDGDGSSYGSPGIYFKYDWSALKIIVRTDRENIINFTIRLCSIISGIIVISGILNFILVSVQKKLLSIFAPQLLHIRLKESPENTPLAKPHIFKEVVVPPTQLVVSNDLITNANIMATKVEAIIPALNKTNEQ
ncbi:endoplasmic reticulum-Golgi intermediate compartment protein 2 [Musca domestica]|uniref:Endoplasmic reticulum-Golgi intermediate compartment protein 2 n=1 Tax=Musca domestica TaxID=7370 RepID=A0A1I8MZ70_MUSDO|nr:endoplasmic reticulum-Golgi intermediate compartment protein 2 [Musca domestica]XP_011291070.1 endoplasmic reticulum-Golgi intermediate compartment protein 2 [Musca domestica]